METLVVEIAESGMLPLRGQSYERLGPVESRWVGVISLGGSLHWLKIVAG